ncbi:MAG: alkaline phosphatase family protein [Actinomycetota bacterium]|nr:alkaline phosphatase family protein [Actinomycetota bacterium]
MSDAGVDAALEVLLGDDLSHVVDLCLTRGDEPGHAQAHAADGSCAFTRDGLLWAKGRNPLERQDAGAFSPLDDELANMRPPADRHSYPFAYDNAAQLFDDPRAPDVAVVHTPAHNWEERGGHRGEHGSLNVVQSRAPLIVSGAGVQKRGRVNGAARMVDVAPTIATLLDAEPAGESLLKWQDGNVLDDVIAVARPKRVVAFLCDGTNANVLYAMAAAGELPAFARLMDEGTWYGHGLIASFPSATLANHTAALTGAHPGHHGVLHNAYYDRATARQIITNAPETWHLAREELSPDVETLHEVVARSGGGFTASVNEPTDRGSGYTTFDFFRRGEVGNLQSALPSPDSIPGATKEFADRKREYGWASGADHLAVQQVTQIWSGANGNPKPRFLWVNLILPDAGNHAGGPYSDIGHAALRDTDVRLGTILDAMDWGAGETAFVVLADHGMEESDPDCKGDFDEALTKAGVTFRDEAYGFLYLDD